MDGVGVERLHVELAPVTDLLLERDPRRSSSSGRNAPVSCRIRATGRFLRAGNVPGDLTPLQRAVQRVPRLAGVLLWGAAIEQDHPQRCPDEPLQQLVANTRIPTSGPVLR